MAASQGDIQALEQAFHSGSDMDCADYDNRWVMNRIYGHHSLFGGNFIPVLLFQNNAYPGEKD